MTVPQKNKANNSAQLKVHNQDFNQQDLNEKEKELFDSYYRLVPFLVHKLTKGFNITLEEREDLIASGYATLWEMVQKFDSTQRNTFKSYVYIRIKGCVIDLLRQRNSSYQKAQRYAEHLKHMLGSMTSKASRPHLPAMGNSPDKFSRLEAVDIIEKIFNVLSDKEQLVVSEYYIHEKKFVDIAAEYPELTKSWISRLHKHALEKMRGAYVDLLAGEIGA